MYYDSKFEIAPRYYFQQYIHSLLHTTITMLFIIQTDQVW